MIKVLFICHGNICRSPMAEFVMKDMVRRAGLAEEFYIESAATSTEEIWNGIGNPVYPPAREVLAQHGISCEGKRARQMKREDYERFDMLIGMDERNIRNMKRICGHGNDEKIWKMMTFARQQEGSSGAQNRPSSGISGDVSSADPCTGRPGGPDLSRLTDAMAFLRKEPAPDVADPWYSGDFQRTWDDVYAACQGLLQILTGK